MATPLILVTNDDGYDAPGLHLLAEALAPVGAVVIVAPDREASATSHALTLRRPLRVRPVAEGRYRVDGTPTDCVHLGVFNLTRGRHPDLVVSGINRGLNLGDDVTYSGTVAGALEGTLLHIPSIAVSAEVGEDGAIANGTAAAFAANVARQVLDRGLPKGVFLNINVPLAKPRGVRVTRQGSRTYRAAVVERLDPAGTPYYWIAGADTTPADEPDSDHAAVREGYISVTPLHANLTHEPSIPVLEDWRWEPGPDA